MDGLPEAVGPRADSPSDKSVSCQERGSSPSQALHKETKIRQETCLALSRNRLQEPATWNTMPLGAMDRHFSESQHMNVGPVPGNYKFRHEYMMYGGGLGGQGGGEGPGLEARLSSVCREL